MPPAHQQAVQLVHCRVCLLCVLDHVSPGVGACPWLLCVCALAGTGGGHPEQRAAWGSGDRSQPLACRRRDRMRACEQDDSLAPDGPTSEEIILAGAVRGAACLLLLSVTTLAAAVSAVTACRCVVADCAASFVVLAAAGVCCLCGCAGLGGLG